MPYNNFYFSLHKMRLFVLCLTLAASHAGPQLTFSNSKPEEQEKPSEGDGVNTRLGLLAGQLGLDPIAQTQGGSSSTSNSGFSSSSSSNSGVTSNSGFSSSNSGSSSQNADFTADSAVASGRIPGNDGQQCCCVPNNEICEDPFGGPDLVGSGAIDPRLKNNTRPKSSISTRIINIPRPTTNQQQNTCPVGQKACCYDANINLSVFGINCINPQSANTFVPWTQGCNENVRGSGKTCGTRQPSPGTSGEFADSQPGEFPWTCLLLNQNNDFVGSCAVIPNDFSNDNNRGTRKIITAAHKLKNVQQNE